MLNWVIILTVCMVALVTADEEPHEYGKYGEWRRTICEKQNQTLNEDIDACFQTECKAVKEATADCMNESVPSAEGSTIEFVAVACVDKSAFTKLDKCMNEYEQNIAYKKQMIVTNETITCYENILEKYGLHELKPILEAEVVKAHALHSETHE